MQCPRKVKSVILQPYNIRVVIVTDLTALQYPCSPQTYNYVTTLTNLKKGRDEPSNRQGAPTARLPTLVRQLVH